MKLLISSILLLVFIQLSFAETWEVTNIKTAKSDTQLMITVTVKNMSNLVQSVPKSPYIGKETFAQPNSYLWPQHLSQEEALSVINSHYYTHNSRSCHKFDKIMVPVGGEISFQMLDKLESVGERLLITFENSLGSEQQIVGAINVPEIKLIKEGME